MWYWSLCGTDSVIGRGRRAQKCLSFGESLELVSNLRFPRSALLIESEWIIWSASGVSSLSDAAASSFLPRCLCRHNFPFNHLNRLHCLSSKLEAHLECAFASHHSLSSVSWSYLRVSEKFSISAACPANARSWSRLVSVKLRRRWHACRSGTWSRG